MRRVILALLCALLLCGCTAPPEKMDEDDLTRLKAYRFPAPPMVQASIDTEPLTEAFGNVAPGMQIVERNISGWHKIQLVYDYPGGKPENWNGMCEALAAGTAAYKGYTTAEIVTPHGALLASAIEGTLTYDAFEDIREPRKGFEHEGNLSAYDSAPYYVSSKNGFYHADGTCGALISRPYYAVGIDDAVDERLSFCPICAAEIREEIKNVERTEVPFVFPDRAPQTTETPDYSDLLDELDDLVCIPKEGERYHSTVLCGNIDPNGAYWIPLDKAIAEGYGRCSNCW